jgi:hypothetical protein
VKVKVWPKTVGFAGEATVVVVAALPIVSCCVADVSGFVEAASAAVRVGVPTFESW